MTSTRILRFAFWRLCFVAAAAGSALLPHSLSASAGEVYVAGAGNSVVSKVALDGSVSSVGGSFTFPRTVRFDRGGTGYVLEDGILPSDGRVYKITPAGERSLVLDKQGGTWDPQALAIDGAGNLYVANNGPDPAEIRKYTLAGTFVSVLTTVPGNIWEMACDSSGNVLATAGSSLYRATPAGVTSTFISFNAQARGVTVDQAGNIFVSSDENIIRKFFPSGGFESFAADVPAPYHLITDANGNLYSTSLIGTSTSGTSFIYRFTPTRVKTVAASAARGGGAEGFKGMDIEPPRGKSLNISTRLRVQSGDDALIGGFIITGSAGKKVIVRAIGPSLANAGVQGALEDPTLELYRGGTFISGNDNWRAGQESAIQATGIPPSDDREAAIALNLAPEAYTAVVRGRGGATGVALVEVYDLEAGADSQLANISTRGRVETGENVMIGGFIIGGNGARGIVRALGPSLTAAGVPDALSNPTLSIRNAAGEEIAMNDDWKVSQRTEIEATGVPPQHDRESAYVGYFAPGNYTAIVSGVGGATGIGLVEFYNLQ